jgi:hypothetical protein
LASIVVEHFMDLLQGSSNLFSEFALL